MPKPPEIKREKLRHYNRGQFVGPPKPPLEWLWPRYGYLALLIWADDQERRRKAQRAREAAWRRANPEKLRVKYRVKRLRRDGVPGRYTQADVDRLFAAQKGKCAVCRDGIKKAFHVDHVMPIALGGTNDPDNLQLLCPPCNQDKGAKHPVGYMQSRGFLL